MYIVKKQKKTRIFSAGLSGLQRLLTDIQFGNDCTIPFDIFFLQVVQQATTLANHLQQTAAGMMVFLVGFQVFGECCNAGGKNRNLYFRRTGVSFVTGMFFDNCLFFFCC